MDASGVKYNQICLTDADCVIHPECPNFFELTENKYTVTNTEGSMDWVCRSLENYRKYIFKESFPLHRYFNAGFQVVNKIHRPLFDELHEFYEKNREQILWMQSNFAVGTDQPLINYIVNLSGVDMKYLHYQYCMADLHRKEILDNDMTFTKVLKGIYQFNAIPENVDGKKTMHWMKKTYEFLYD